MRSRLAYTLSFWLLGAVVSSVLAMGALTAWNLRQGFGAYLQARDLERFDKFVLLATRRLSEGGGARDGQAPRPDMRALLREVAVLDGAAVADRPPPPGGPGAIERPGPPRGPGPGRGPGAEDRFGSRVSLAQPDGRPWAGPPIAASEAGVVERPIRVDGVIVALARLRPLARAPDASEAHFLRSQYLGIVAVAAALLVLALAAAIWLARQWVRPLHAVQMATARIAKGELDVRLPIVRGDEIGDLIRNVNAMAESLQRIDGARRRWLADLSHELRTPLTVLRGEIEALVDGVRPLGHAALASLRDEVLRLGQLIEDLHLLAMADLQALPCHPTDGDAVAIVGAAMRRQQRLMTSAGLTMAWAQGPAQASMPPMPPMPVHLDAARIEQLVVNLLQNSLRYTDAPGRIEVDLAVAGDQVQLRIDDSAPGVAAEDLQRIFEPLFRADPARSRRQGGSGLGLAICVAIVRAHGGTIQASPSPLGGLRVQVALPALAQPEAR